ncbi:IucC family-domain-containing protein [Talaromyces proteolyticus]|uniref:IucC family-domain-containing protein n=1 Tax=Talaromyces proteolyticus TaxID=1131652 RepID=A0AAD4PWU7_9EURO|nr:IucC family-domain-containing protein [Talaromyces proteolyticus]KAH8695485.1 IucC family-domain-containing protein [Talaromyces proteolyticus]
MDKSAERKRAEHASLARVAACLINERFVTITFSDEYITLSHPDTNEKVLIHLPQPFLFEDILDASELPGHVTYKGDAVHDGAQLIRIIGKWTNIEYGILKRVCREFDNSVANMELAYGRQLSLTYDSPAIEWEQALIEAHGLHPWHKCRYPEVGHFLDAKLYFVTIPREGVTVVGDYDERIRRIAPIEQVDDDSIIFPVHELQLPRVKSEFPQAKVLDKTITGRSQSSVRTITIPGADCCVKMPLALKITSNVRTIKPWSITIGYRLQPVLHLVEQAAESFGGSLTVIREYGAASTSSLHLGCVLRQSLESIEAETGDKLIVCVALMEHLHLVWAPETLEEKLELLREFCHHLFRAIAPSVLLYGFALQAHAQNLLIRLHPETRAIHGFYIRDFTSYRVHRESFIEASSLDIDTTSFITTMDSRDKVYRYMHTVLHTHVASMVLALKVGDAGWRVARQELEKIIPENDELALEWLNSPCVEARATLAMQIYGVDKELTLVPVTNRFYYCQHK